MTVSMAQRPCILLRTIGQKLSIFSSSTAVTLSWDRGRFGGRDYVHILNLALANRLPQLSNRNIIAVAGAKLARSRGRQLHLRLQNIELSRGSGLKTSDREAHGFFRLVDGFPHRGGKLGGLFDRKKSPADFDFGSESRFAFGEARLLHK